MSVNLKDTTLVNRPDQPDPDAIKMFLGQIPKNWSETEIHELLDPYGPIFSLNILREKGSSLSKGCCFVTFYTRKAALEAQNALHNVKTLTGMHHCIQMKPADIENKTEDRKLFVGMLNKQLMERDVRRMFSQFGNIEECRVLVNRDGISKGCAFVTFSRKSAAQNAIHCMHQSTTMEGCSAPIVVKLADSPKERERKKVQAQISQQLSQFTNQWKSLSSLAAFAPMAQALAANNPYLVNNLANLTPTQLQHAFMLATAAAQTLIASQGQKMNGCPSPTASKSTSSFVGQHHSGSSSVPSAVPFPKAGYNLNAGGSSLYGSLSGHDHSESSFALRPSAGAVDRNNSPIQLDPTAGMLGTSSSNYNTPTSNNSMLNHPPLSFQSLTPAGSHREGPDGSNLFIYHLPTHFTDHDLLQSFAPYGTVVSAKVFIDKQTNLSKCFGFVSYDNPVSAQHAIQAMHGYQIGMKRLKVQLKRPKNETATNKQASSTY